MRGQRIYNDITKEPGLSVVNRKGRNNTLVTRRNECLLARYYYYCNRNKCYEEILQLLMTEFFLSHVTISYIVQQNAEQLQLLKQNHPSLFYYQNRWPHMKW